MRKGKTGFKKAHHGYYGLPILSMMIGIIFLIGLVVIYFVSKLFGWVIVGFGSYIGVSYGISLMLIHQKREEDFPDFL